MSSSGVGTPGRIGPAGWVVPVQNLPDPACDDLNLLPAAVHVNDAFLPGTIPAEGC